jgi:DNA-directed RNA polymerase specialized sigma24 family protein
MTAKEYFKAVVHAERELMVIRAKIRHYQDIGYSITGGSMDSPVVSHSRGSSRVEAAAMGIFDATAELERQAAEFLTIVRKAEALIARIPQDRYRQILTLRYMAGWSFRSISDELRYQDEKSVYRAHGYALAEAQKILDKMTI